MSVVETESGPVDSRTGELVEAPSPAVEKAAPKNSEGGKTEAAQQALVRFAAPPSEGGTPIEIPRDRWGRPLILPDPEADPNGSIRAYTRASTLGKVLEEQSALTAWKLRMALVGASLAPHILVSASAFRDDRNKLDELAQQALDTAQAHGKAEIGTALHRLTEKVDRHEDPGPVPAEYRADLAAYQRATDGWAYVAAETFVVCDELAVAGTFDRLRLVTLPDGRQVLRIVDIKTGQRVDYAGVSFGVQTSVYAHGKLYDPATGRRGALVRGDVEVDLTTGYIVHLPSSQGRCDVHEVDLIAGWEAAQIAVRVKALRNEAKRWLRLVHKGQPAPVTNDAGQPVHDPIASAIAQASSEPELSEIWTYYQQWWTDAHTELVQARLVLLQTGAVA